MHYRLRTPDKATAQALAQTLGIEWNGEDTHLTIQDDRGRMDVVVLGDLPVQDAEGNIVIDEVDGTPVMTGFYHIDILSEYELSSDADQYLTTPNYPLHKFL